MFARCGAAPLRRRTSSPLRTPGRTISGDHATRATSSTWVAWKVSLPFNVPKSLVLTRHRHLHDAAAEQRADGADRDLLHARRLVGAPVVGQEGDLRVRLARRCVHQRVHRLVVALGPRGHEGLDRRPALVVLELARDEHVAGVAERRHHHDRPRHDAQRRPAAALAAPPARADFGADRNSDRLGACTRAIRPTSTPAGHLSVVLAGRPIRYPQSADEHGRVHHDEAAYRELVEPHRRELQAHCYRMLGSVQDAEDALQDALLRAWKALDRFQGRSSTRSWLYRIATNTCLDALARRPKRVLPITTTTRRWGRRCGSSRAPTRSPRATSSARASSWPSSPRCSTCRPTSAPC